MMNRAIARRTLFESRADIEVFVAALAEAVEKGLLRVHAFTVLATHFHLLVESPVGALASAMRHLQLTYVRHFNRARRRDGPLVRGRFMSKRVDSMAYRTTLVAYIDMNAPAARIVASADLYPHCSAHHYARATSGPAWLTRDWVEGLVCAAAGIDAYRPSCYAEAFWHGFTNEHHEVVRRRLEDPRPLTEPLDDLVTGSDAAVRRWMMRKARLADGTAPGMVIVAQAHVDSALAAFGDVPYRGGHTGPAAQPTTWARVLLLRRLCGLRIAEVASAMSYSTASANTAIARASRAMDEDESFASAVSAIAHDALRRCYRRSAGQDRGINTLKN